MGRKKRYKNKKNATNATIVQGSNSSVINTKLDTIQKDTDEIKKISKSKLPINQADLKKNNPLSAEGSYAATVAARSNEKRKIAVFAGYAESTTKLPITAKLGR